MARSKDSVQRRDPIFDNETLLSSDRTSCPLSQTLPERLATRQPAVPSEEGTQQREGISGSKAFPICKSVFFP